MENLTCMLDAEVFEPCHRQSAEGLSTPSYSTNENLCLNRGAQKKKRKKKKEHFQIKIYVLICCLFADTF